MKKLSMAIGALAGLLSGPLFAGDTNQSAVRPADVSPGSSLQQNTGVVLCMAAVNSDGTRPAGAGLAESTSIHLGTGEYEVDFLRQCSNVTAANGFARWLQVDTLTEGSISGVSCTTADRAGNIAGVFVLCTNSSGVATDTSFFLFVAR